MNQSFVERPVSASSNDIRQPPRKMVPDTFSIPKELFWIEGTTRRFKDGYNYFGRHPEKIIAFFDKHMKQEAAALRKSVSKDK